MSWGFSWWTIAYKVWTVVHLRISLWSSKFWENHSLNVPTVVVNIDSSLLTLWMKISSTGMRLPLECSNACGIRQLLEAGHICPPPQCLLSSSRLTGLTWKDLPQKSDSVMAKWMVYAVSLNTERFCLLMRKILKNYVILQLTTYVKSRRILNTMLWWLFLILKNFFRFYNLKEKHLDFHNSICFANHSNTLIVYWHFQKIVGKVYH